MFQSGLAPELLCYRQLSHIHDIHHYMHSSGFFIIMSPAEGLHFSALVLIRSPCLYYALFYNPVSASLKSRNLTALFFKTITPAGFFFISKIIITWGMHIIIRRFFVCSMPWILCKVEKAV